MKRIFYAKCQPELLPFLRKEGVAFGFEKCLTVPSLGLLKVNTVPDEIVKFSQYSRIVDKIQVEVGSFKNVKSKFKKNRAKLELLPETVRFQRIFAFGQSKRI